MPYDHLITGLPFIKVEAVTHGYPIRVQCRVANKRTNDNLWCALSVARNGR